MNIKKSSKILAFASFIIILGIAFILIGTLQNTDTATGMGISSGMAGFLLGIVIVLSLINMLLVLRLTTESKTKEDYLKKTTDTPIDEISTDEESSTQDQDEKEEQFDIDGIEQKILPPKDKKTDTDKFTEAILNNIAGEFDLVQGLFYVRKDNSDTFTISGKFAYFGEEEPRDFELGSSLSGQTAKNQKVLNLKKIPENYITILSGLGSSSPNSLLLVPVIHNGKSIGVIELASFKNFDKKTEDIFTQLSERIGARLAETL